MVTKGETQHGGVNQKLGMNKHTAVFKIDNQQRPTVQHGELYSIFCDNLY